ncbi:aminomethyl-transferring glycine dehydrogenase subunit GcvPB [soil metagenome]
MTVMGPATATEPTVFEKSRPGRRSSVFAVADVPDVDLDEVLAGVELADEPPALPEIAELDLVRHFTRMSQRNHGIDVGFYPLGSCSMKYNPRVSERVAALGGFAGAHPWAPAAAVQGTLAALWELEQWLTELTGLHAATLQPAAGAQGELVGLLVIRAYHEHRDDIDRDVIIVPDSAHGTNPASATIAGFTTVTVPSGDDGLVDVDALEELVDERTAGLMLTNPNTLGLFEVEIERIAQAVHGAGGLLYYDGANFNAIAGRVRPGDMGFDVVHLNVHKTFATPHGGGGPGAGPVVVSERLAPYLPAPVVVVVVDDSAQPTYRFDWDRPQSIGRVHGFHGNTGVLLRALSYLQRHGGDGLASMSAKAVLNANYLAQRTAEVLPLAYPQHPPMHEFVLRGTAVREHGVKVLDVCKRLIDLGYHPPTNYFPLIVDEALMIEPTETETPEMLDGFAEALGQAVDEAATDPDLLHAAPQSTPVRRLDEATAARNPVLRWHPEPADQ